MAAVAGACEALGIGCIIEPMARGLRVGDAIYRAEFIALGARMACEIGADVLKTDYSGDAESFRQVVAACASAGTSAPAAPTRAAAIAAPAATRLQRFVLLMRNSLSAENTDIPSHYPYRPSNGHMFRESQQSQRECRQVPWPQ